MIQKWNETISPEDTVYHLGDFGDYNFVKQLNGNIILILGNYEEADLKNNFDGDFERFEKFLKGLTTHAQGGGKTGCPWGNVFKITAT